MSCWCDPSGIFLRYLTVLLDQSALDGRGGGRRKEEEERGEMEREEERDEREERGRRRRRRVRSMLILKIGTGA